MKGISISTCFNYNIDLQEQLLLIQKAGFTHFSVGGNHEHSSILENDGICKIKALMAEYDLSIDTIHGYAMDKPDAIEINRKIVNAANRLHVPIVVLHCSSFAFHPSSLEVRKKDIAAKLSFYEALAKENGICFALENLMPGIPTDFMEQILMNSNPEYFGFCYDSAHDQIDGPRPFTLLDKLSDRLKAVHLSDRIKEFVDHVTPGEGFIDFKEISTRLHLLQPKFPLLMEVMMTHSQYNDPKEFLSVTYSEAKKLYDRIF